MTQAQIISASNAVYFDNVSGSITPTAVRNLNTDWINSTVTTDMVSGLTVASASYAATANTALTATSSQTATSATSASYATTSSLPLGGVVSATALDSTITFTKGDATTFSVTVSQSGSVSTASLALNSELLDGLDSTSFVTTSSFNSFSSSLVTNYATKAQVTSSVSVLSGSVQVSQNALSSSLSSRVVSLENFSSSLDATFATDASVTASIAALSSSIAPDIASKLPTSTFTPFSSSVSTRFGLAPTLAGNNTFTGNNIFGNVTASNAQFNSASIEYLSVIYQTSSVVYSSGSNVFGDAANDTQTLWGTVNIVTGPLNVTGSTNVNGASNFIGGDFKVTDQARNGEFDVDTFKVNVQKSAQVTGSLNVSGGITGSLLGTASNAVTASYAIQANTAFTATSSLSTISASYAIQANTALTATSSISATTANTAIASVTASYAANANNAYAATSSLTSISSSYAATASVLLGSVTSASFATTANSVNALSQSLVITGSFNGLVVSQSIASNTSSLNFGTANFFTSAVTSTTFFNITNPKPGETVNVLLTTVGAATASFSSNVKQPSGSAYTPSAGNAKQDILTFVSFDGTTVYLANVKNLI